MDTCSYRECRTGGLIEKKIERPRVPVFFFKIYISLSPLSSKTVENNLMIFEQAHRRTFSDELKDNRVLICLHDSQPCNTLLT